MNTDMAMLFVVAGCLAFLFVSTFVWALRHLQLYSSGDQEAPEGLLKAHAWGAAIPFFLVWVLIIASVLALLSSNTSGLESLVSALSTTVVRAGLVVCTLATGMVFVLCIRGWRIPGWSIGQKLHYSAFTAVLVFSLVCLLTVGAG
ncbi:MAG: hypothetical protein JW846_02325 [Dehalococcoidia bacterium]|nr:hypothetical protein [Dehalococcoidia bacterium]